ncbi:MAG: response regulator, partial [Burkholderiaceae bacterium]|nr:response regulator [Burkholderiaceae bacterium]
RQLRRRLGVDQPESVAELLRTLALLVETAAPGSAHAALANRLPHFFDTVEQTYAQSERDQALRNRSMAISSAELSEANQRLRESSARQQAVIDAMRATADGMLVAAGQATLAAGETSLESLSGTVLELVRDREETRRRLAESESRFRGLTAISSDWYWEQDDELRYVFVSAGVESVMSSSQTFLGRRRWESDGAQIGGHELAAHQEDLAARRPFRDFEYQLIAADGQMHWISTSGDPLIDTDGRFLGYRGTGKDITERKQSQAQIADNLRLIEALLESIPDAIAIRSPQGMTLRVNAAFQRLFAPLGASLLGETELPPVLGSPGQHAAEGRLLRAGGVHRCQVQLDPDADNPARVYLVQRAAFSGEDGAIAGLVVTLTDISELEQTRRQAISAQHTAEHAMKVRSQFLANMSHEVRTPMNGVLGIAGMLLETPLSETQRELATLLQTSGRALLTILNDILDFSKIEAGKVKLESTAFDLREAVRSQVAMFAATARDRGLAIDLSVDQRLPAQVTGDPTRLGQVLSNLIGNALKFTQHGRVEVSVEPAGELIRIDVRDTGLGIDPSVQAKIFEAFSQADDSTTRRFGGTGLGLAICRDLVTIMGGEIGLDSQPGVGSRFWFTVRLPAAQPAAPASAQSTTGAGASAATEARASSATDGGARALTDSDARPAAEPTAPSRAFDLEILLAEDNVVNQRVARAMLNSLGCRVTVVGDGQAAIDAALAADFDLILMDCHMPGIDGFGATAALRAAETASGTHRVIIAQTAMAMQGDREQCLAAGMDDYITKPFSRTDLHTLLTRWQPAPLGRSDSPVGTAPERVELTPGR